MLEFQSFSKTFGSGKRAVDGLSLKVEPGDVFGFIGHNGAGKTTAIRCAVGALGFEEGDILIAQKSIRKDPIACKKVMAYIPDNPDIYDHLTGMGYIDFIADIFGVDTIERRRLTERFATEFDMNDSLPELIASYSHGMKQKLVLICALIHSPLLFVMDEPFVGLDPKAAHTLKGIMREMCKEGAAVFFSTHVLEVAEKLCNKIAIIKGGRLVACGNTDEVRGNSSLEDVFMELIEK